MNKFINALEGITAGMTTTLFGIVVTRYTADSFEVGTWGKSVQTLDAAAALLKNLAE